MDKKKVAIIAVILFLGLGTFVFANPSERNLKEDDLNDADVRYDRSSDDGDDSSEDSGVSSIDDDKVTEALGSVGLESDGNTSIVTPNAVIADINRYFNGNNTYPNTGSGQGGTSQNIGFGSNIGGNNNSGNSGNTGDSPVTPEVPSDKPDVSVPDEYDEIRTLVKSLNNMVLSAQNKTNIDEARNYRENNNIIGIVSTIENTEVKNELQTILNEVNSVLDDYDVPVIEGINDLDYTNKDVVISIKEDNLGTVILNDVDITNNLELLKNITDDNTYTLIVMDKAYNKTKVTFTVDKTAPVIKVTTSNNGETLTNNVVVTIKANEELQAVDGWTLSSDKKSLYKNFNKNTDGEESIEVKDKAGNKTTVKYQVLKVDSAKPVVKDEDVIYSTKEATNGDVVVTFKVSKPIFIPKGWTMVADYTEFTRTYAENATEKVILRDVAGNTNAIDIVVNNIDKVDPVVEVGYSVPAYKITNKRVVVTIKANEKIKKLKDNSWKLSEDATMLQKTFTKNTDGEQLIEIEDLAGNTVKVPVDVSNIDKEFGGITIKTSNYDVSTNSDVTVTITSPKEMGEVEGWVLSGDRKKLTRVFSESVLDIVDVTTIDGKVYAVEYEVKNLDKTTPKVEKDDIIYEVIENGIIKVTVKVTKPVFTPTGWEMVEGYSIFTKEYTTDADEMVFLRDIYGNTNTVNIKVDVNAVKQINELEVCNTNIFSTMTNSIFG